MIPAEVRPISGGTMKVIIIQRRGDYLTWLMICRHQLKAKHASMKVYQQQVRMPVYNE